MATEKKQDWRALCKAVSVEQNSERLRTLLVELLKSMDEPSTKSNGASPATST